MCASLAGFFEAPTTAITLYLRITSAGEIVELCITKNRSLDVSATSIYLHSRLGYFVTSVSTSSSMSLWSIPTLWPPNFTLFPQMRAYLNSSFMFL